MNSYTGSNGMYGTIQIMALDYVFHLWAEAFGDERKRAAQGEPKNVAAPQATIRQMEAAPTACGC